MGCTTCMCELALKWPGLREAERWKEAGGKSLGVRLLSHWEKVVPCVLFGLPVARLGNYQ